MAAKKAKKMTAPNPLLATAGLWITIDLPADESQRGELIEDIKAFEAVEGYYQYSMPAFFQPGGRYTLCWPWFDDPAEGDDPTTRGRIHGEVREILDGLAAKYPEAAVYLSTLKITDANPDSAVGIAVFWEGHHTCGLSSLVKNLPHTVREEVLGFDWVIFTDPEADRQATLEAILDRSKKIPTVHVQPKSLVLEGDIPPVSIDSPPHRITAYHLAQQIAASVPMRGVLHSPGAHNFDGETLVRMGVAVERTNVGTLDLIERPDGSHEVRFELSSEIIEALREAGAVI